METVSDQRQSRLAHNLIGRAQGDSASRDDLTGRCEKVCPSRNDLLKLDEALTLLDNILARRDENLIIMNRNLIAGDEIPGRTRESLFHQEEKLTGVDETLINARELLISLAVMNRPAPQDVVRADISQIDLLSTLLHP